MIGEEGKKKKLYLFICNF